MLKVKFKLTSLFSLKKYDDSNLKCQSYEYPTVYAVRSALIGAIIQTEGKDRAEELFYKIKNANIYVSLPNEYKTNCILQRRFSNSYYSKFDVLDRDIIYNNSKTTMGAREYVHMDEIVIYIDKSIPNIEMYLKNIDSLGTSESLVYLSDIEETNDLTDILVEWDKQEYCEIYEQYDWDSKAKFENVYMYDKASRKQRRFMCCVKDITIN